MARNGEGPPAVRRDGAGGAGRVRRSARPTGDARGGSRLPSGPTEPDAGRSCVVLGPACDRSGQYWAGAGPSRRRPIFFLSRVLKDNPQGTTNRQPPTANRQPPPTANRQPPPTIVQFRDFVSCPCLAHVLTMQQKASP